MMVLAAALSLCVSYVLGAFSLLGGRAFATVIIGALAALHAAAIAFAVIQARRNRTGFAALALLSPAPVAFAGVWVAAALQNGWRIYAPDPNRDVACRETGIQIMNTPSAPVAAVYVDWDTMDRDLMSNYGVNSDGHLTGFGDSIPDPEMLVYSPYADVVVTHELSDPEEARKGLRLRGLIKYTLTATDRRDGRTLGTMKFAIDMARGHACGANVPGHIDIDAFLRQVTHSPESTGQPSPDASVHAVTLQKVDEEIYSPERTMTGAQWSDLIIDSTRREKCEAMVPSIGPLRHRFSADPSGLRSMVLKQGQDLICDDAAIIHLGWNVETKTWFITKYWPDGNLVYRISFIDPGSFSGYHGAVMPRSVQSQDGFLTFEYLNQNQAGYNRQISRRIRFRVKEPPAAAHAPDPPGVSSPAWAAYTPKVKLESLPNGLGTFPR